MSKLFSDYVTNLANRYEATNAYAWTTNYGYNEHITNAIAHGGGMSVHGDTFHVNSYPTNTAYDAHVVNATAHGGGISGYAVNTDSRFTDAREPTQHNSSFHSVIYPTNTLHYNHVDNATAHGASMSAHGNEYHSPGFLVNTAPYAVNTDGRFTDSREPTAHNSSFHSVGYLINTTPYAVNTDSRLTDAREPTAHNSSFHSVVYATNTIHYLHEDNAVPHTVITGYGVNTDSRLTDSRTPTSHGIALHSDAYAVNSDARLTDSRTPTSHGIALHSDAYAVNSDTRFTDARNPVAHNSVLHSVAYAYTQGNGYVAPTQLGLSPSATTFLRGDNAWTVVTNAVVATTVTNEVPWGVVPAVGTAVSYAREDHTHGTPLSRLTSTVLGATFTTTSNTLGNAGVTISLLASNTYYFKFNILYQMQRTNAGPYLAVYGPTSPTSFAVQGRIPVNTIGQQSFYQGAYNAGGTSVATVTANVDVLATIEGMIVVAATAGTLNLMAGSSNNNANTYLKILAGSTVIIQQLP